MLSSQEFRDDHSESLDVDVDNLIPEDQTGNNTHEHQIPASPLKRPHPGAIDDIDSDELLDDPEADLDEAKSPLSNLLRGMQEPDPKLAMTATDTGNTSAVPHRSSDNDERPLKRARIDNRIDVSDQTHGMFKFFKTVSKEEWRAATDEEARRNKGKWEDIQKQALFAKLAKQERIREQTRNRKHAQRAREKVAKGQTVPVS